MRLMLTAVAVASFLGWPAAQATDDPFKGYRDCISLNHEAELCKDKLADEHKATVTFESVESAVARSIATLKQQERLHSPWSWGALRKADPGYGSGAPRDRHM